MSATRNCGQTSEFHRGTHQHNNHHIPRDAACFSLLYECGRLALGTRALQVQHFGHHKLLPKTMIEGTGTFTCKSVSRTQTLIPSEIYRDAFAPRAALVCRIPRMTNAHETCLQRASQKYFFKHIGRRDQLRFMEHPLQLCCLVCRHKVFNNKIRSCVSSTRDRNICGPPVFGQLAMLVRHSMRSPQTAPQDSLPPAKC